MNNNIYKLLVRGISVMTDKNYDTDLKYAQWNPFFISLQKDIDQIKNINKVIRKDTTLIDEFFSLINTLFNSTKVYSSEPKTMQLKLDKIETKIYNPKYLTDLKEGNVTGIMINYQHKIIKNLETIFQIMIDDFASKDLLPKIIKTEKKPKGRALLG